MPADMVTAPEDPGPHRFRRGDGGARRRRAEGPECPPGVREVPPRRPMTNQVARSVKRGNLDACRSVMGALMVVRRSRVTQDLVAQWRGPGRTPGEPGAERPLAARGQAEDAPRARA